MKKFIRKLFKLAILLIAVLAVAGLVYRWVGHRALQKQITDLHAAGEKLTFQELSTPVSTNAADCLSALTNATQETAAVPAKGSVDGVNLLAFSDAGRVRVAWNTDNPTWVTTDRRGAALTWAELSNFVAQISAPLANLQLAMRQPAANLGRENDSDSSLIVSERLAMQRLAVAAMLELHHGRRAEALANIQALTGLANFNRDGNDVPGQVMRLQVIDCGLNATWQLLQAAEWSGESLLELQHCWENIDALEPLRRAATMDRAETLRIPVTIADKETRYPANAPLKEILRWGLDRSERVLVFDTVLENDLAFRLRHTQSEVALANSLRTNRVWREVRDSFDALNARLSKRNHVPQRWLYPFSLLSIDLKPAATAAVRAETTRRLTLTAIALRRYQMKHGQLPPTLEKLAPDFLAAVPIDCMNGQPLRYQARGDGTFTLYSVGEDGRDNGGDPNPPKGVAKAGLWEGRDAVWPWPAKP